MQNNEKEFFIPKNVNPQFEVFKNVGWKDMLFFVPSLIADIPILFLVPNIPLKIAAAAITLFIPFVLVFIRPIRERENIPAWKVLLWEFEYMKRKKKFTYRKRVDNFVFKK